MPDLSEGRGGGFPDSRQLAVNVASVPQRSPLRYPGGKTWLIPHVEKWLDQHDQKQKWLLEPFCGGAIVSLSSVMEGWVEHCVMSEIDPDVAAFWKAVLENGECLAKRVKGFKISREEVESWNARDPKNTIQRGFRTLVLNRTRRGGILEPGAAFIKYGENGKGLTSRWYPETISNRIMEISKHAERIQFKEGNGMIELEKSLRENDPRIAVFADPPYTAGGKRAGLRLYAHHTVDHEKLFAMLDDSSAEFLMTYDEVPEIVNLVRKHDFHAVRVLMKNGHHNKIPELIITPKPVFE